MFTFQQNIITTYFFCFSLFLHYKIILSFFMMSGRGVLQYAHRIRRTFFFCIFPQPFMSFPFPFMSFPRRRESISLSLQGTQRRGNPVILADILLLENGDCYFFDLKRCLCPFFPKRVPLLIIFF